MTQTLVTFWYIYIIYLNLSIYEGISHVSFLRWSKSHISCSCHMCHMFHPRTRCHPEDCEEMTWNDLNVLNISSWSVLACRDLAQITLLMFNMEPTIFWSSQKHSCLAMAMGSFAKHVAILAILVIFISKPNAYSKHQQKTYRYEFPLGFQGG